MKKIGRRTKQLSGLMLVLAMLAGGLVPPGGAQERKGKQSSSPRTKTLRPRTISRIRLGRLRLRAIGTATSRST